MGKIKYDEYNDMLYFNTTPIFGEFSDDMHSNIAPLRFAVANKANEAFKEKLDGMFNFASFPRHSIRLGLFMTITSDQFIKMCDDKSTESYNKNKAYLDALIDKVNYYEALMNKHVHGETMTNLLRLQNIFGKDSLYDLDIDSWKPKVSILFSDDGAIGTDVREAGVPLDISDEDANKLYVLMKGKAKMYSNGQAVLNLCGKYMEKDFILDGILTNDSYTITAIPMNEPAKKFNLFEFKRDNIDEIIDCIKDIPKAIRVSLLKNKMPIYPSYPYSGIEYLLSTQDRKFNLTDEMEEEKLTKCVQNKKTNDWPGYTGITGYSAYSGFSGYSGCS